MVISLGTDTTDLVVTNGFRVWQRNIPIGGNHFTQALTKELKLTFAKAEHLKRNATQADDPKAVFQAMRPVFSDLVAEIQRSIGYFTSIDKAAKIGDVIALGNAMKLPGLQRYLSQNLEQEVKPIEDFNRLTAGSAAGNAAVQGEHAQLRVLRTACACRRSASRSCKTNLLPEEIVRKRMIRAKKPWAVAGVAAVLAGLTFNYFTHVSSWRSADVTNRDDFKSAISLAKTTKTSADGLEAERTGIKTAAEGLIKTQEQLTSNVEGRLEWLDLVKALDAALPRDPRPREETAEHVMSRNEVHITALDERHFADLTAEYITPIDAKYLESKNEDAAAGAATGDPAAACRRGCSWRHGGRRSGNCRPRGRRRRAAAGEPLTGPGFVIQLTGYHYHNADQTNQTRKFVIDTLVKALEEGTVKLPDGYDEEAKKLTGELVDVSFKDMGISRPWLVAGKPLKQEFIDPDAELMGEGGMSQGCRPALTSRPPRRAPVAGAEGAAAEPTGPVSRAFEVKRYDFVVQFCWQPKTRAERREAAAKRLAAEAEAAAAKEAEAAAAAEQPPAQ